jgi:hypothetical protein
LGKKKTTTSTEADNEHFRNQLRLELRPANFVFPLKPSETLAKVDMDGFNVFVPRAGEGGG